MAGVEYMEGGSVAASDGEGVDLCNNVV